MSTEPENGAGFVEGFDESEEFTEDDIVTITNEEGHNVDCAIVAVLVHNEEQYVMLNPVHQLIDDNCEEMDAYVYHYQVGDDELPIFSEIDDDATFEAVCDAFSDM